MRPPGQTRGDNRRAPPEAVPTRTRAIVLAGALLLASCSPLGVREPDRYFVLEAAPASAAALAAAAGVRVAPTSAASFYDTQGIVYSRAPGTRAFYQFSQWTERPQRAIYAQLQARLGAGAPAAAWLLQTRVDEIYHDAATPPGQARIALTAQLLDPATRVVLAQRTFSVSAPAASYDAPGAVVGFGLALGALLDELVPWVATAAPAPGPPVADATRPRP